MNSIKRSPGMQEAIDVYEMLQEYKKDVVYPVLEKTRLSEYKVSSTLDDKIRVSDIATNENIRLMLENKFLTTKSDPVFDFSNSFLVAKHKIIDSFDPVNTNLDFNYGFVEVVAKYSKSVSENIEQKLNQDKFDSLGTVDIEFFERPNTQKYVLEKYGYESIKQMKSEFGKDVIHDDSEKIHLKYVHAKSRRTNEQTFFPIYLGFGSNMFFDYRKPETSKSRFYRWDLERGIEETNSVRLQSMGSEPLEYAFNVLAREEESLIRAVLEPELTCEELDYFVPRIKAFDSKVIDDMIGKDLIGGYFLISHPGYEHDVGSMLNWLTIVDVNNTYKHIITDSKESKQEFVFKDDSFLADTIEKLIPEYYLFAAEKTNSSKFLGRHQNILDKVNSTLFDGPASTHFQKANIPASVRDALYIESEEPLLRLKNACLLAFTYLNSGFMSKIRESISHDEKGFNGSEKFADLFIYR